jgi:hypothetical protein
MTNLINRNKKKLMKTEPVGIFLRGAAVFIASWTIQACCTKAIKIPPRVDGQNITLENARKGYYNLVVQLEVCRLCDTDRDLADEVSANATGIFELRVDEKLTNEEYNAYIESIQAQLMQVRRVCNTLAIADENAGVPGNEGKYTMSQKAVDLTAQLQVARQHSRETLTAAREFAAGKP